MPLSEHEQRLLDQIERALYAEDPKFASTVRSTDLRTHMRRRLRRAGIVFVLGFVLLVAGVSINIIVSVVGFVVMLVALLLALAAWKRVGNGPPQAAPARAPGQERPARPSRSPRVGRSRGSVAQPSPRTGWRQRLEDRWQRRWEERGGEGRDR